MKKLIFGSVLMLCGVIGGTGWLIASTSIVQGGAWSTVLNVQESKQVTDNCINIFPSSCSVIKGWIYVVNGRQSECIIHFGDRLRIIVCFRKDKEKRFALVGIPMAGIGCSVGIGSVCVPS